MIRVRWVAWIVFVWMSCWNPRAQVDTLFYNATIYTVNKTQDTAEAMAVRNGRIVAVGPFAEITKKFRSKQQVDLRGYYVFPSFMDAHCHVVGYAPHLAQVDLVGTTSWQEVIDRLVRYAHERPTGWIVGRGWDQNDWPDRRIPSNDTLNLLFPRRPVFLKRIDGHACLVNQYALELAGITPATRVQGGHIEQRQGRLTGFLLDEAMTMVERLIDPPDRRAVQEALLQLQQQCFAVGLTAICEAGITKSQIELVDSLQRAGLLQLRVAAMVADDSASKAYYWKQGPVQTDRLTVRSVKYFSDGALGSRGALLLRPYSDSPQTIGIAIRDADYLRREGVQCLQYGFQMCTHAIGDSANRLVLDVYCDLLQGPNDLRWRIEHCQVIAPDDFKRFASCSVVPSVQPVHATSDMYWAVDRIGVYRLKGAYAYRNLLKQTGWIAAGSDFPVEALNPLHGFYAAVVRKDQRGYPPNGFQSEQALTREEALKSMTIWAARASFLEKSIGSLEPGKWADFVVLEENLMAVPVDRLFSIRVLATYMDGKQVYALPGTEHLN